MRPLGTRLICDHCEGMFLEPSDLETNLGTSEAVELVDDGAAAATACPKCLRTMRGADLKVNERSYGYVVHCPTDGIWFEVDVLIDLFRKVSGRSSSAGPYMGADPGVYVGAHRTKSRSIRFTMPESAFDGKRLGCPVCQASLLREHDRWPCGACKGTFVESNALEAMVMDMVGQPWTMPPPTGTPGERGCPVCTAPMIVEQLEAVTIDRCDHGVWFDPTELGNVLHSVGSDRRRGVIGWLKRVF
jgi:Zn-finger nucleic acid-binding protein